MPVAVLFIKMVHRGLCKKVHYIKIKNFLLKKRDSSIYLNCILNIKMLFWRYNNGF